MLPCIFALLTVACAPESTPAGPTLRVLGTLATNGPVARSQPPPPTDCPDDTQGGVAGRLTPDGYALAIRHLTLLGVGDTADVVLDDTPDVADAEEAEVTADDTELVRAGVRPPPGTYDGLELELWWMRVDAPMVLPTAGDEPELRTMRGWFDDVDPVQKRDLTFDVEDQEVWVDRDDGSLAPTTGDRPERVLDLWDEEDFWSQDPVVISSREADGQSFRFETEDGDTLEVTEDMTSEVIVHLELRITDRLTWWESEGEADGVYTAGVDCGLHPLFPDVAIWFEEP